MFINFKFRAKVIISRKNVSNNDYKREKELKTGTILHEKWTKKER